VSSRKKPTKKTPPKPNQKLPAQPPAAVQAAAAQERPALSQDKLLALKDGVRRMRDAELVVINAEEALTRAQQVLNDIRLDELPKLMEECGVTSVGIEAEGNLPPYEAKAKAFYNASISAEHAAEAFAWLRKQGHGDLIKNIITVQLGMGEDKVAKKLLAAIKKLKVDCEQKTSVHGSTLKAFVKEQIEKYQTTPPLDLLGIVMGRVVELKEKK
jgi:hypothetical protein